MPQSSFLNRSTPITQQQTYRNIALHALPGIDEAPLLPPRHTSNTGRSVELPLPEATPRPPDDPRSFFADMASDFLRNWPVVAGSTIGLLISIFVVFLMVNYVYKKDPDSDSPFRRNLPPTREY